jgi:uncharacterized membrane protein
MLASYVVTIVTLITIDLPWLLFFTRPRVNGFLLALNAAPVRATLYQLTMAAVLYVFLGGALCAFAVRERQGQECLVRGAQLGLLTFGVFDLTTAAFFGRVYPIVLLVFDPLWGCVLCASSAGLASALLKHFEV